MPAINALLPAAIRNSNHLFQVGTLNFCIEPQLKRELIDTLEQPLRSIGNPETGTCSLVPDIAFVIILSNFTGANLKLRIGFMSEICDELPRSVKDFLLLPKLKLLLLSFEIL